jgi:hypothetical protein
MLAQSLVAVRIGNKNGVRHPACKILEQSYQGKARIAGLYPSYYHTHPIDEISTYTCPKQSFSKAIARLC